MVNIGCAGAIVCMPNGLLQTFHFIVISLHFSRPPSVSSLVLHFIYIYTRASLFCARFKSLCPGIQTKRYELTTTKILLVSPSPLLTLFLSNPEYQAALLLSSPSTNINLLSLYPLLSTASSFPHPLFSPSQNITSLSSYY